MNPGNLTMALNRIAAELHPMYYLQEISTLIIGGTATRSGIDGILSSHDVHPSIAKVAFLHFIFAYIKIALEDDILNDEEIETIHYLKALFSIQPGDFYLHNKSDVDTTISYQLNKIYQDNFVSQEEADLKARMQEAFDLSFDQMNEHSKVYAASSIKQGADALDLDVFFTYNEYFKLRGEAGPSHY